MVVLLELDCIFIPPYIGAIKWKRNPKNNIGILTESKVIVKTLWDETNWQKWSVPPSFYYTGSSLLQCIRCARQQVEAWQGFATDPYDLERLYSTTEEGAEQLIKEAIATVWSPSSSCLLPSTSMLDINSIHEEDKALEDLSANEIPLELDLVFLLPEIQRLYQEHQVAWWEALSHSPAHKVGFALGMNSRERGNRYRMPMPYLRHCMRQRKVYVADEHK